MTAEDRIAGRWAVDKELGRGSMGRVVQVHARDHESAGGVPTRSYACKVLERSDLRTDFVREYRLLRALAHPGFVAPRRLLQIPQPPQATPGSPAQAPGLFALLELVDGAPLVPGPHPDAALPVARALLEALDHLHRKGFVHGDLAPGNVLWRPGAPPLTKILDLGAGGLAGSRAGATSGVLAYAAPERLAGAGLSVTGDLWSVGALVFGLAHGRHPFPGYPARTSKSPDRVGLMPHPLDPWLDRLLDPDPLQRHPSATIALAELDALAGDAPPTDLQGELPFVDPRPAEGGAGRIERAAAELAAAAIAKRPLALDIRGLPGSGRSRALVAILEELAARGVAALELPPREDSPELWLGDALDAIGTLGASGGEATLVDALGRAVLAASSPICLAADDLDSSPAVRAMLERLVRAMMSAPERFAGLVLVGVGLGADSYAGSSLTLAPWSASDLATLLEARFPARTVRQRDLDALIEASRGQIGLLAATLEEARRGNVLRVDSTQLILDVQRLADVAPPSLDRAAADLLARLPAAERHLAGVLAHAQLPVPDADALLAAGVAVSSAGGAILGSEAMRRAARSLIPEVTAHLELARLFASANRAAPSLAHRLLAAAEPDLAAVERTAEALLGRSDLAPADGRLLLDALCSRPGWPRTAAVAATAGTCRERWGDTGGALELHRRASELAPDAPTRAAAWLSIGRLESRRARFPRALEAYREALDAAPSDPRLTLELLAGEARAAAFSGELDAAEASAERGLALLSGLPAAEAAPHLARLSYTRALVDWYRGQLDLAEPRLESALAAAREAGDVVEEAAIVTARGLISHRRGDLERAARSYTEALKLGESAHDESRVLTALQNLGVVRHELGEWTEALDTYLHAFALAEALDARAKIAQLAGNLGNLWRYLGEAERASQVLERGLAIAREDHNRHLEALIGNLLGDVASDRGDPSAAEACYRRAIAVATEAGCRPEATEASLNLVRLLTERFDLVGASALLGPLLSELDANRPTSSDGKEGPRVQARWLSAAIDRRRGLDARPALQAALADLEALKNPDARWPIYLEAALEARDRDDLATADTWAREVRRVLQAQLDRVPGRHREAFSARRDRRAAHHETSSLIGGRREESAGRALGWSRLLEVHKRLALEHSVQRLLEYIMDSAILLTGAERGFLLLDDDSHKEGLEVRIARNLDQENIRNRHLKISRGIARRVIASGEAVVTVDAMEDERYREQLSVVDLRLRSIMCLPMALRGRVLGAIYLDNRFRSSAFSDEDLRFMEAFADMAAIALDNARLVESLEHQKKQNEAARKEIESLNERLRAELEHRTRELEDTRVAILEERRSQAIEHSFENIIGTAPALRRVFQTIERLRNTDIPVLIEGESGTGKELVARAIHFSGSRRDKPFIAVNCGAIPATLLESELFGHVRGAFTNATSDKKGLFEAAHHGTLFLDEIGEMPLEMQVKLLRVLQSGELQKVGAPRQITVDVRIVAATNRRLEDEVHAGRFREDLFYRLSVVPIVVPPLRDRREDIPLLVQHFIAINRKNKLGQVTGISKDALALLQRYAWPGNVRQLETVLKNASVFAEGSTLLPRDLDAFPDIVGAASAPSSQSAMRLGGHTLAELERMAIVQTLRDNKGNKKRTAELLGIDRRTLYNKLAAYGIAIESDLKVT